MLSKQQISFLRSLHQKKYRQIYAKFLVEGDKPVRELLTSGWKIEAIYKLKGTELEQEFGGAVYDVTEDELKKISTLQSPNEALAVVHIPAAESNLIIQEGEAGPIIVCDNLNDPGNAGTIIRTADWFGIKKIFFSQNSVEVYNPKAVSASKGSLFRVGCVYADLKMLFSANSSIPVYGTFTEGENIYEANLAQRSFILIGNEANGISDDLLSFINKKISIPRYGNAESLNAALAAGIIMSEIKRRLKE